MQITKAKYDGSKVRIEYQQPRPGGGEPDEFSVACCDKPRREFDDRLQALVADVVTICELAPTDAAALTVRGVSCTYKDDVFGVCITALKALRTSNAPLVLNSPHLPEQAYSGNPGDPNPILPAGVADRVRRLLAEAERYVAGDRAQGSLFTPPATETR